MSKLFDVVYVIGLRFCRHSLVPLLSVKITLTSPFARYFTKFSRKSLVSKIPKYSDIIAHELRNDKYVGREEEVGITQYLNATHKGISGLLKQCYSDFIVNEISLSREVVRLTDLGFNKPGHVTTRIQSSKLNKACDILKDYIANDIIQHLRKLHEGHTSEHIYINVDHLSCGSQNRLMVCIQNHLPKLKVRTRKHASKKYFVTEHKIESSKELLQKPPITKKHTHLHFVLYKVNMSNFDAFTTICRKLNIPLSKLSFAGLKDKRAITCQMVSLSTRGIIYENISKLCRLDGIKVGKFHFQENPIKVGYLYGNHFEIILREVTASDDDINKSLKNLKESGFINYFGVQRFGNISSTSNVDVGRNLLQKDWEGAVQFILKPRDFDEPVKLAECRRIWWESRDPKAALDCLPDSMKSGIEAHLLKSFIFNGTREFKQALKDLPYFQLKFYMNSYASYIWNCVVSKRIEKYGLNILPGDLFHKKILGENVKPSEMNPSFVTEGILHCEDTNIFDVVVPVLGDLVQLPSNETGDWCKEFLALDSLNIDVFKTCDISAGRGTYRYMIVQPENLSWRILKYNHPEEPLSECDYERMQGKCLKLKSFGERKAVKVVFQLQSSSYATMAIREITKMSRTN